MAVKISTHFLLKHIPILLISDAFLGRNTIHLGAPSESVALYTSTPNIVAAANNSIVVPQTEFCFSCFKWFSNVVGGSIVETRGQG